MRCYQNFLQSVGRKVRHAHSPNHYRPLQSSPLRSICNNPNISAMIKAVLEVLLCHRLQYLLQFGFNPLYGVKYLPLELDFHLGEEQEVTGD